MTEDPKARLAAIDDVLQSDETVQFDVLALLLDPGGNLKKREAEGHLVLTNRRLIFGTAKHGLLIDLPRSEINPPASVKNKYLMAHLKLEDRSGEGHTLVLKKPGAAGIARILNRGTG